MTPQQQRIAIAKICGWNAIHEINKEIFGSKVEGVCTFVPDYLNDLNAMHEAEKLNLRTLDQYKHYSDLLKSAVQDAQYPLSAVDARYQSVSATASQRAEAFLRTIGKWVSS